MVKAGYEKETGHNLLPLNPPPQSIKEGDFNAVIKGVILL
jgi:hypothetical protein